MRYNCEKCCYETDNRNYLKQHKKTKKHIYINNVYSYRYKCDKSPDCKYESNDYSNYKRHINGKKHAKPSTIFKFICEPCSYRTNIKSNYIYHLLTLKHKTNILI